MKKSNQEALRTTLRMYDDGLTVVQLANLTGLEVDGINRSLKCMPDTYIDRWIYKRGQFAGVWCVVVPPEDCPRPERKK